MIVKDILERTTKFFKDRGIESARFDTEQLLGHVLKYERLDLYMKFDQLLSKDEIDQCRELVMRRGKGEPVAYILGSKGFFKNDFQVTSDVLVPRPETEHLVEAVVQWTQSYGGEKPYRIIDLGSGSGCVGLSLIKELPNSELLSVDVSEKAIEVTLENATQLGVRSRVKGLHKDAKFLSAKDLENFKENRVDIIVSNPPYIPINSKEIQSSVKKYEPHLALFAGSDGLDCIKSWSAIASNLLTGGGLWAFEMGSGQGLDSERILTDLRTFTDIQLIKDYSKHDRVMTAMRKE